MAANDHRRQKKLQRRAAKRKERHKSLIKHKNRGLADQLAAAKSAPILDSLVSDDVREHGLADVMLSRQLPNGEVAFAMFLVDTNCLGVTDVFAKVSSRGAYRVTLEHLQKETALIELPPADLRRLVEGAVEYARDLGLEPHPDYRRAQAIFGDINPEEAKEQFTFGGEDGKPLFIASPDESPARRQRILSTLEQTCGKHGFHYIMPIDGAPTRGLAESSRLGDDYEDEKEEEDDEDDEDEFEEDDD